MDPSAKPPLAPAFNRPARFLKLPSFRYPELHRGEELAQNGGYQATQEFGSTEDPTSSGARGPSPQRTTVPRNGTGSSESGVIEDGATPDSPAGTPVLAGQEGSHKAKANGELGQAEGEQQEMETEGDVAYYGLEETVGRDATAEPRVGFMNFELLDVPRAGGLALSSLQHILCLLGNFIVIPMTLVPAMGGTHVDAALVINAGLMASGLSTTLHILFGSRLPLVQASSFVYLAPALAIATGSPTVLAIEDPEQRFSQAMREIMGAVICSSVAQLLLGYSGFMSLLIELLNPVVVAPTIAAVGLSLFSVGFPKMGPCFEIGVPYLVIAAIFSLYLRRVSLSGSRFFQVYAVSLPLLIVWVYAAILTGAGVYNHSACDASNLLTSSQCAASQLARDTCRTDASDSAAQTPWFPPPYPFRFGTPLFEWSSVFVMLPAAVISVADSVANYHASSLLVASRPPTGGIVSRGIGLEGLTSILAGALGTGTGATTLSENVHVIAVTRMGSRAAVLLAAGILFFLSLFGKIGGVLAMIPPVIVGAMLCIMAPLVCALGLSCLRYSEMGSSRNLLITGMALYLSLSVPGYFQTYTAANGHGPVNTSNAQVNFFINSFFSLNMVIAFLVAFLLDNTVPGSPMERGLFVWSTPEAVQYDEGVREEYDLPWGLGNYFRWAYWLGLP